MAFLVISERHGLRAKAEGFIRDVYEQQYGAKLGAFPCVLLAAINSRGEFLCAAGFRRRVDGFFSERYLDIPVEAALARISGHSVARNRVFEISTFASRSPNSVPSFVGDAIDYADMLGFEWGFFTLTRRLWQLLGQLGLDLRFLASADPARIEDAHTWGSYYKKDPRVYAGNSESLSQRFAARRGSASNA